MNEKKRIDLHITADIYEELKQLASKKDITVTTLLKLIIQDYLDEREVFSTNEAK